MSATAVQLSQPVMRTPDLALERYQANRNSFEHFDNPAQILNLMDGLLKPRGQVLVSFGPPWYHPLGGHLFSVFRGRICFSARKHCAGAMNSLDRHFTNPL